MRNHDLKHKKKFEILLRLTKKYKNSSIPPIVENDLIVNSAEEKSDIFNNFFAEKSSLPSFDDEAPELEKLDVPE